MECKIKNDLGTIYIAEDVMMKVVGYAALECYGIVAMSGKNQNNQSNQNRNEQNQNNQQNRNQNEQNQNSRQDKCGENRK